MRNKIFIGIAGIITLVSVPLVGHELFIFASHGFSRDYYLIDRCQDNGGCWDYSNRTCRNARGDSPKEPKACKLK
ncbi:hypothetical protein [Bdellovibrio svalbardensis]|uniref:Uncharacterized protein n=1 Tax=Bdellovibrio svalbardensis TaxID=2972972 RepID=A0ABT6DI35_9BACT|nr:hypothetical protein [Bdellovibrio svalbardensis]MDG0816492.1 hypothetical protein [Bdellovibrio svalbardensis]